MVFKRSRDTDTPQIVEKTISLGNNHRKVPLNSLLFVFTGYSTEYCTKEVIYVKTKQDILTPVCSSASLYNSNVCFVD